MLRPSPIFPKSTQSTQNQSIKAFFNAYLPLKLIPAPPRAGVQSKLMLAAAGERRPSRCRRPTTTLFNILPKARRRRSECGPGGPGTRALRIHSGLCSKDTIYYHGFTLEKGLR